MNALEEWMADSRRENDHMEIGCLTEVTERDKIIAYVVPRERTDRGLLIVDVLYTEDMLF